MQQKEIGFKNYFEEKGSQVKIETVNIRVDNNIRLKEVLDSCNEMDGVYVTTSKAYILVENGVSVPIIGYDLLAKNVKYLKEGKIKFLINQNPRLQIKQGLSLLADFMLNRNPVPNEKLLPIEIVSSENIYSYHM